MCVRGRRSKRAVLESNWNGLMTMTKEEVLQYKQRWQFVNEHIAEEIRNTPPEVRFQQLRTMVATAHVLHPSATTDELTEVRERWFRLKERLNASS